MNNSIRSRIKDLGEIPILEGSALHRMHYGNRLHMPIDNNYFHINRLEDHRNKISFPLPPHRKTVHDLIFIRKGCSVRSKGLNQYEFTVNQCFVLPALQITTHESMSEDVKGFFIHFSPDLFAEFPGLLAQFSYFKLHIHPIISIPDEATQAIYNILERLWTLYAVNKVKRKDKIIISYLFTLFSELDQYAQLNIPKVTNTATKLTQRFKDALTQHIYEYRTIQEYADLLHVTPNHLNKCVKKTLNKTAQAVLNEMLLLEAKSLLKYSNLTIFEISMSLFKSTPSNFSRFFKKHTGLSPSQFSKQ